MNEPHGYDIGELKELYAGWIDRYTVPRRRIVLDGAGYATDVNSIGNDPRFDSCLLSFHYYTWFDENLTTTADWELPVASLKYPERTIVTEFGAPMTTGKDFLGAPGNDRELTYIQGMTTQLHNSKVGGIYWPGIRTNDSYSMFSIDNGKLTTNNTSGLKRLQYAWGIGSVETVVPVFNVNKNYSIVNRNSNKSIGVNGSSLDNGAAVVQWDFQSDDNQLWSLQKESNGYFSVENKRSNKLLDVQNSSTTAGNNIVQWERSMLSNQEWMITDIGFGYYKITNRNSGLSLDVNSGSTNNGTNIIQWYWNRGSNQQWMIKENQ